jgi:hypothetical protein
MLELKRHVCAMQTIIEIIILNFLLLHQSFSMFYA